MKMIINLLNNSLSFAKAINWIFLYQKHVPRLPQTNLCISLFLLPLFKTHMHLSIGRLKCIMLLKQYACIIWEHNVIWRVRSAIQGLCYALWGVCYMIRVVFDVGILYFIFDIRTTFYDMRSVLCEMGEICDVVVLCIMGALW